MVRQPVALEVMALWVLQPDNAQAMTAQSRIREYIGLGNAKKIAGRSFPASIVDITFQLLDDEFLLVEHLLDDVADRNHANHLFVLQHR